MSLPLSIVIVLLSISWSAGVFVGLLTAKFVSKRECNLKTNNIHARIDNIQDLLAGGKIHFELRQVQEAKT